MEQIRIQSYWQQQADERRRAQRSRQFARNQALGVLMVAALICLWWMVHSRPGWILPAGWWRP